MTNPFVHIARQIFTPQQRAYIFALCDGICGGGCGRKLRPGERWHVEHRIALENGGTNDPANLYVCCEWCHKPKTAEDHAKAGHARRVYTIHVVPGEYRRSPSWRRRW